MARHFPWQVGIVTRPFHLPVFPLPGQKKTISSPRPEGTPRWSHYRVRPIPDSAYRIDPIRVPNTTKKDAGVEEMIPTQGSHFTRLGARDSEYYIFLLRNLLRSHYVSLGFYYVLPCLFH